MPALLSRLRRTIADFRKDESGVGTVNSLFFAAMSMLIGGVAIDGTNLWRHQQLMQQTADAAAHAGVIQLALGASESDAKAAVEDYIERNMPFADYGLLVGQSDIEFLTYDPASNIVNTGGVPNAVRVTLHRDETTGNPLDTFVLRMSDLLTFSQTTSLSQWDIAIEGVATVAQTQRCSSTDGIYAKGQISLSGDNTIGSRYCMHSQDFIWMSQGNTFMPDAALSMPDLADCNNKCVDSANPGTTNASWETNMILPDYASKIDEMAATFLSTSYNVTKDNFFLGKPLETGAFQHLEDIGIDTSTLGKGDVVELTVDQAESLPILPMGLVYNVTCKVNGNSGNVKSTLTLSGSNFGADLQNVALVTNCYMKFAQGATANAVALITTNDADASTVTAVSGASIGGAKNFCDNASRSMLLVKGGMHVAAKFLGSNLDVVVDGEIAFAASSNSGTIEHHGLNLHATGDIKISTGHTFDSCAHPPSGLSLPLLNIRYIVPQQAAIAQS